jgi:hypothetical protein
LTEKIRRRDAGDVVLADHRARQCAVTAEVRLGRVVDAMHRVVIRGPVDAGDVDALAAQEVRQAQLLVDPPRDLRRVSAMPVTLSVGKISVITCCTDGVARSASSAAITWRITTARPADRHRGRGW